VAGEAGNYDAEGGFSASDYSFTGLRAGFAFAQDPDLTLGAAFEYGDWSWDSDDALIPESADGETYKFGAFAEWRPGDWRVNAALFVGQQQVDSLTGATVGGAGTATYDATVYGLGVEAGRVFAMGDMTVTPTAGLDLLGWSSPRITETGGLAPLTVASEDLVQVRPSLGVRLAQRMTLDGGGLLDLGASARLMWALGDQAGSTTSSGGVTYTVDGPSNGFAAEFGAQASLAVAPNASLVGAVTATFAENGDSYGGFLGYRVTF
jgi:outer membrane autotransporter protein